MKKLRKSCLLCVENSAPYPCKQHRSFPILLRPLHFVPTIKLDPKDTYPNLFLVSRCFSELGPIKLKIVLDNVPLKSEAHSLWMKSS